MVAAIGIVGLGLVAGDRAVETRRPARLLDGSTRRAATHSALSAAGLTEAVQRTLAAESQEEYAPAVTASATATPRANNAAQRFTTTFNRAGVTIESVPGAAAFPGLHLNLPSDEGSALTPNPVRGKDGRVEYRRASDGAADDQPSEADVLNGVHHRAVATNRAGAATSTTAMLTVTAGDGDSLDTSFNRGPNNDIIAFP